MSEKEAEKLEDLVQELAQASTRLVDAERALSHARSAETNARNAVNVLQGKIDDALRAMRKTAPRDSEWWLLEQKRGMRA